MSDTARVGHDADILTIGRKSSSNPDLRHQPSYTAMSRRKSTSPELFCDMEMSITSPVLSVNGADMDHQNVILSFLQAHTGRRYQAFNPRSLTPNNR